jgi:RimJ/RimL family protein N-acetyltransferase
MPVVLETERLLLRVPDWHDAGAFVDAVADEEVMRYIGDGLPHGPEEAARWIETDRRRWELDGFGRFAVVRREDDRVIGRVGLSAWHPETWVHASRAEVGPQAEIELGWTLVRPMWGHGYATEAARAVRDWATQELGLRRLISLIHPQNMQSKRVAERLDETYERDIVTAKGYPAEVWSFNSSAHERAARARPPA